MVRDICIIQNFILPSLNNRKYGHLMEWVDVEKSIFKVFWTHRSRRSWTKRDFIVFLDWDKLKGRTNIDDPEFFTKSKGRFRAALYRLSQVVELSSTIPGYKMYQLNLPIQDLMASPCHVPETYVAVPTSPTFSDLSVDVTTSPCHVPEICVATPASPTTSSFYDLEETEKNEQQNIPQIFNNEENYFENLPDEKSYSLDAINGEHVTFNIEEQRNVTEILPVVTEQQLLEILSNIESIIPLDQHFDIAL